MGKDNRSPRILLTRLNDFGDCVMTLPLVNALRAHFPNAFLCWVVQPPSDQIIRHHPAADRIIVAPPNWTKSPIQWWRLSRQLRRETFDIAIDPQGASKSAWLARMSRASRRIGFTKPAAASRLSALLNTELVSPKRTHFIDRQLELLRPLGIRLPRVEFAIGRDQQSEDRVNDFTRLAHLGCDFVVINPGAGWRSRRWIPARFGCVSKYLGQRYQVPSVVTWAGKQEWQWANEIVTNSGGHALLATQTDLMQLAALLRRAQFFVGCDTGPMHLAHAVGTDCVALHGPTRPEHTGAYGHRHIAVQKAVQTGTLRQLRRADNQAMQAIDVEAVCDACDVMLARHAAAPINRRAA